MTDQKTTKEDPRFVSTTGKPELLALLSGHTASVSTDPEGTPLHPRFHRIAILQGVVPLAMFESTMEANANAQTVNMQLDRQQLIVKAISEMVAVASDDEAKRAELFTNDGRPDARAISTRCGFPVNASERDKAWTVYADEDEGSSD